MSIERESLEKRIAELDELIRNAPQNIPKELLDSWKAEYDILSFDLNNLYDDNIND